MRLWLHRFPHPADFFLAGQQHWMFANRLEFVFVFLAWKALNFAAFQRPAVFVVKSFLLNAHLSALSWVKVQWSNDVGGVGVHGQGEQLENMKGGLWCDLLNFTMVSQPKLIHLRCRTGIYIHIYSYVLMRFEISVKIFNKMHFPSFFSREMKDIQGKNSIRIIKLTSWNFSESLSTETSFALGYWLSEQSLEMSSTVASHPPETILKQKHDLEKILFLVWNIKFGDFFFPIHFQSLWMNTIWTFSRRSFNDQNPKYDIEYTLNGRALAICCHTRSSSEKTIKARLYDNDHRRNDTSERKVQWRESIAELILFRWGANNAIVTSHLNHTDFFIRKMVPIADEDSSDNTFARSLPERAWKLPHAVYSIHCTRKSVIGFQDASIKLSRGKNDAGTTNKLRVGN